MQYTPAVLKPGANEIAETKIFEESHTAKDWVSRKWVDIKRPKTAKDGIEALGLTGFAPDVAQYVIEQCYDAVLLGRFNALETRGEVKALISDRINAIKNEEEDRLKAIY